MTNEDIQNNMIYFLEDEVANKYKNAFENKQITESQYQIYLDEIDNIKNFDYKKEYAYLNKDMDFILEDIENKLNSLEAELLEKLENFKEQNALNVENKDSDNLLNLKYDSFHYETSYFINLAKLNSFFHDENLNNEMKLNLINDETEKFFNYLHLNQTTIPDEYFNVCIQLISDNKEKFEEILNKKEEEIQSKVRKQ